jgi:predicted anti-sigma-YlaC factor YlaD
VKKCADYLQELSDYLDGQLDAQLCADIEKHVGECHNCKLMFDSLKMTVKLCRESGQCEELPKEFADRLNQAIKDKWAAKFGKS